MYANWGGDVVENDAEVVKWCRKAADQGHASAHGEATFTVIQSFKYCNVN